MHIAIDCDQTITAAPELFGVVMTALRDAGVRVTVLTANDDPGAPANLLESHGLQDCYDALVVVTNDDDERAAAKARYCDEAGVDLLIDDNPENCAAANAVTATATFAATGKLPA